MAPMPVALKTPVMTSSSTFIERFGTVTATDVTALLFTSPTGRKYACTVMSLLPEGLKMRASVWKLLTVPAMERNTSFAKTFVAKRERAEIANRSRNRIRFLLVRVRRLYAAGRTSVPSQHVSSQRVDGCDADHKTVRNVITA